MATFLPQVQTYIPQLETFTPDYKFLQDVLDTRQDRYTNNYKQLNDLYGKVVYADLSRDDNKAIRDQFSKELTPKLEQISGMDLSMQQNVNTAKGLFKPFYEDKNMVFDMYYTKQYGKQMSHAQSLLRSPEEKERWKYSEWGVQDLKYQMDDFKSASREESTNRNAPYFTNNVNLVEMGIEALKKHGMKIKKTTSDGKWLVTTQNGHLLTNQLTGYQPIVDKSGKPTGKLDYKKPIYSSPAMEYLQETLIHDPAVAQAYYVKNKTLARQNAEANADQFGSVEKAKEEWAKAVLKKYGLEIPKEIVKVNAQLQDKTEQIKNWEAYKNDKGIIPGSAEEDVLLKSRYERDLLDKTLQMKNKTYKDVAGPAQNLELLLQKAYRAKSAMEMNKDMAAAAIQYSYIDYEETKKADPFALKQMDHQFAIMRQNNKHRLDKALERYKKTLEGGDQGYNVFGPGGDPNSATKKTDTNLTERQKYNALDRYMDQYRDAEEKLTAKNLQFTELVYNNLDTYNNQLRTQDGKSELAPNGTVTYKKAILDDNGAVARYDQVTNSWADAMMDFTGPGAFHNKSEADRLFKSAYKAAYSRDFESDNLSVEVPLDAQLIAKGPQLETQFNNARTTILAYQSRMIEADKNFNSAYLAAYQKWNAESKQRDGGFRSGAKWNSGKSKKVQKKLDKAEDKFAKGDKDRYQRKGQKKLDAIDSISDRSEHDWGMFPTILSNKQIKDLRNGKLWTDIIKSGEELSGVGADDPEAANLRILDKGEYTQLLVQNMKEQEEEVLKRFNEYIDKTGKRGRRFERNDEFLTRNKRNFLGLWTQWRTGEQDYPTVVGKFWEWDSSSGKMYFDAGKAKTYADTYYEAVSHGINTTMLDSDAAGTAHAMPREWIQLFNDTPGDGSGEMLQHNIYGFAYDGLNLKGSQTQLAIPELNNMFTMFNEMPEGEWDVATGDHGGNLPEGSPNWRRGKNFRAKKKAQGSDKASDYTQGVKLLDQIQLDLNTGATTKGTTPQFEVEYREHLQGGDGEWGSYTIKLGEEYANKYKGAGNIMEGNTEFKDSNSVTFYFKKNGDNSSYKSVNQSFDDIKVITDQNGTYQQDVYGGGSYWFTRNSGGQYVGNVILNKFDPSTGNFIPDIDTKKQVIIDTSTSSLTQTATQLDMHLQQTAESNIEDQNAYKQNFAGQ